jgi:cysteine desulfurase / selenocysteine lyase
MQTCIAACIASPIGRLKLDRDGMAVRAGTPRAMPVRQRFGATATCRASFALYNTREEVDGLATTALRKAHRLLT